MDDSMQKISPIGDQSARLTRAGLTTLDIVFFVLAAAAPLTVVAGAMPLAILSGGKAAVYGYLVPGLVLLVFSVGFTAMSPLIRNAGAFYSYICRGIAKPVGIGAALVALLSYNAMTICLLAGFSFFVQNMLSTIFSLAVPWQLIALLSIIAVAFLGYFKVTLSAKVLGIALGLELLVVVVYEAFMLVQGGARDLGAELFDPTLLVSDGFGALLVITAAAFIGFEATALYAEEARDPRRTIPRATYIAIAFLAGFYAFSAWCLFVAYGPDNAVQVAQGEQIAELVTGSMTQYVGSWIADVAQILLCTSAFAGALAFHNAAARYFFALGRQRVLPAGFSRVSRKYGTPFGGTIAQTFVSVVVIAFAAVVGADPYLVVFVWSAAPGTIGIIALEAATSIAVVSYFARDRQGHSIWRVVIAPVAAAIGLSALTLLSVWQVDLLTGATSAVNWSLLVPLPILFVVGICIAYRIRQKDRSAYDRLGSEDIEGDMTD
jgi:amino acid transporter